MENKKDLNEGSKRIGDSRKIVAESRRKAREAADQSLKEMQEEESLKERPLIEMKNARSHGITGFETPSRELKNYEQSSAWKWLMPVPETLKEASTNKSENRFIGGFFEKGFAGLKDMERLIRPLNERSGDREAKENIHLTGLVETVNEVFKRAIGSGLLNRTSQNRIPFLKEPLTESGDMGWGWTEWKNSPLAMVMTTPQVSLAEASGAAYKVHNVWSKMADSLMQGIEEVPGLARFFLPNKSQPTLREEKRRNQSLFTQGGGIPLQEFRNLREEKLTAVSEMDGASPELRSQIRANLFRISAERAKNDRAYDSIGESVLQVAEAAKGVKKEEKDALLAEIMKIKGDTMEIKDMVRRIRDKHSGPTPGEAQAPKLDLPTNLEGSEWDELRELVRKGLLPG